MWDTHSIAISALVAAAAVIASAAVSDDCTRVSAVDFPKDSAMPGRSEHTPGVTQKPKITTATTTMKEPPHVRCGCCGTQTGLRDFWLCVDPLFFLERTFRAQRMPTKWNTVCMFPESSGVPWNRAQTRPTATMPLRAQRHRLLARSPVRRTEASTETVLRIRRTRESIESTQAPTTKTQSIVGAIMGAMMKSLRKAAMGGVYMRPFLDEKYFMSPSANALRTRS